MTKDIATGFKKMLQNQSNAEELEEMLESLQEDQHSEAYLALIAEQLAVPLAGGTISPELRGRLDLRLQQILEHGAIEESPKPKSSLRLTLAAVWPVVAAAIILIAGISYFFFRSVEQDIQQSDIYAHNKAHDIPAGTNKATLTLANGKQIVLDDAANGLVAQQSGVIISKGANGQLIYSLSPSGRGGEAREGSPLSLQGGSLPEGESNRIAYNTITTPKGGQFQVFLPDGSMVYLNAASSLKYPVKFTGNERKVTLTGEAYFEIVKHTNQPFIVSSSNQVLRVLGTHFDVSSYAGEPVKTTLAEGRVEISSPAFSQKLQLKPGEQATLSSIGKDAKGKEGGFTVAQVRADDVIAWKDGLFVFTNTELKDLLRQIARWYDVEVDYVTIPDVNFDGEISRKTTLLQVLKLIEAGSDIPFHLEGRRIMRK